MSGDYCQPDSRTNEFVLDFDWQPVNCRRSTLYRLPDDSIAEARAGPFAHHETSHGVSRASIHPKRVFNDNHSHLPSLLVFVPQPCHPSLVTTRPLGGLESYICGSPSRTYHARRRGLQYPPLVIIPCLVTVCLLALSPLPALTDSTRLLSTCTCRYTTCDGTCSHGRHPSAPPARYHALHCICALLRLGGVSLQLQGGWMLDLISPGREVIRVCAFVSLGLFLLSRPFAEQSFQSFSLLLRSLLKQRSLFRQFEAKGSSR